MGRTTRKSKSSKPRKITANGKNVCALCGSATKHRPSCFKSTSKTFSVPMEANASSSDEEVTETADQGLLLDEVISPDQEVDLAAQSFLRLEWERRKKTLPTLKHFKRAEWTLDRMLWPTWKFTTSDPYLQTQKFPSEIEYSLGSVDVYVFCPHTFWSHLLKDFVVRCPACGQSDGVALDGWNTTFREIVELGRNSYIISRRYRHRNCPIAASSAKNSSIFTSLNSKFICSLPELVSSQLEMIVFPRTIVSSDVEVLLAKCSSSLRSD